MNIAIIPARKGSKRIKDKNIKEFCGQPMISWSIQAALNSNCFDHVIVSTDSEHIAEVSRHYGAEVPFMRPEELSGDLTPTLPVLAHAIEATEQVFSKKVDFGCCLYATAPFVTEELLKQGNEILQADLNLEYAFSVATYPFPIQRALMVNSENRVKMVHSENEMVRSQDLDERYHDAGQFYWFRRNAVFENYGVFNARSAAVQIPRERVQDIDTLEDWACAELTYKILNNK